MQPACRGETPSADSISRGVARCCGALAKHLLEQKEILYAWSFHTGATRKDSWIDIEGGIATLTAYAALAAAELPSGRILHEGPPITLGKQGHWMGTHILVPREGLAMHINAFNFPVWGSSKSLHPVF
jgi:oxepin-CoA hydrolase/3-oxo-5,6-dehydrosuberyl-CoA semialdehyde dehydrogenase